MIWPSYYSIYIVGIIDMHDAYKGKKRLLAFSWVLSHPLSLIHCDYAHMLDDQSDGVELKPLFSFSGSLQ